MSGFTKIFDAQTSNATTITLNWEGRSGLFMAKGTWNGAHVELEMSPDDGATWYNMGTSYRLTDDGVISFDLNPCKIRVDLHSVHPSTSITAHVSKDNTGYNKWPNN